MIEQIYINSWIGKVLIELLSNIYIYIPLMLIGIVIIVRNNSVKSCLLVVVSILCLILSILYTLQPLEILFFTDTDTQSSLQAFAIVSSVITFTIFLFRNRSFLNSWLIIIGVTAFALSDCFKLYMFGTIISMVEALILYGIYLMINKKFLLNKNKWVSLQYTHSGYVLVDILLLGNIIIFTVFIILVALLFKMFT